MSTQTDVERDLLDFMSNMRIIDSHEHLPPEADRVGQPRDFSHLYSHYCISDLKAAGMPNREMGRFFGTEASVEEKWRLFAPYYHVIQDGSYARAAHLAIEKFYGLGRLASADDAARLTAAMAEANVSGLYSRVLQDACGIVTAMNFGSLDDDPRVLQAGALRERLHRGVQGRHPRSGRRAGYLVLDAVRLRGGGAREAAPQQR